MSPTTSDWGGWRGGGGGCDGWGGGLGAQWGAVRAAGAAPRPPRTCPARALAFHCWRHSAASSQQRTTASTSSPLTCRMGAFMAYGFRVIRVGRAEQSGAPPDRCRASSLPTPRPTPGAPGLAMPHTPTQTSTSSRHPERHVPNPADANSADLGDVGAVGRRPALFGVGREGDLVVDDYVNLRKGAGVRAGVRAGVDARVGRSQGCGQGSHLAGGTPTPHPPPPPPPPFPSHRAPRGVVGQVRHVQGLVHHALPRERPVAVQEHAHSARPVGVLRKVLLGPHLGRWGGQGRE